MLHHNQVWKEQVLQPLLAYPRNSSPLDLSEKVMLLSADVDRIQEYVFESARLPEIRGASMLVDELNRADASTWIHPVRTVGDLFRDEPGDLRQAIVYSGGGSLLAILPDRDTATRLQVAIQQLFPERTDRVTTTCIIHETTVGNLVEGYCSRLSTEALVTMKRDRPADWKRIADSFDLAPGMEAAAAAAAMAAVGGFGQMVKLMSIWLRREKDSRSHFIFHEALPHTQRCRSCGSRAANLVGQYTGELETWPLCTPCALKLEDRRERRSARLDRLPPEYYAAADRVEPANDLTEIAACAQARPGYVGFIYADGDSVGRFMESRHTPRDYQLASRQLSQATEQAVYQALANFLRPTIIQRKRADGTDERVLIHPFEIITIGGDDVLLVVPAEVALPIAVSISQAFRQQLQAERLTMSVGVVLAPAHTPVRILRDTARQLLKSAKRRAREARNAGRLEGGLDFLVFLSQSALRRDLGDLRQTYPVRLPGEGQAGQLRLTGAPYTLDEAARLLNLLREMRYADFPASQIQQLVAALRDGRERSSVYFLYQQARLAKRPYGQILKNIDQLWPFRPQDPIPWQQVVKERPDPDPDVGYTSMLPDLAELFAFVPKERAVLQRWATVLDKVLATEVTHADSP